MKITLPALTTASNLPTTSPTSWHPVAWIELEYARRLGKRVIPLNQLVIFQTAPKNLSAADQHVLHHFYQFNAQQQANITKQECQHTE